MEIHSANSELTVFVISEMYSLWATELWKKTETHRAVKVEMKRTEYWRGVVFQNCNIWEFWVVSFSD